MTEAIEIHEILLTLGGLFMLGLLSDLLGKHTAIPRVTLLLLVGIIIGPAVLDVLPVFIYEWFPVLTSISLAMIGFLLAQRLTAPDINEMGREVISMSLGVVIITSLLMFTVLVLFGVRIEIALILAGIASATAPASTMDVINELEAKGKFSNKVLSIVAIDDVWGLLIFSILLALAAALGDTSSAYQLMGSGFKEIAGAIALGICLGVPMAYLTGRIRRGEPTQAEALGLVLLCAGLAVWLQVSYLLAAMIMGVVVANLAQHHSRPFHEIEGIEWPFLILFFLLAGALLKIESLFQIGWLGIAYIVLRILGRVIGAQVGGKIAGVDKVTRQWIGFTLLPQAGVAIGMALVAAERFPEFADKILPIILATTVIFELLGPVIARSVLIKMGEVEDDN